MVKWIRWMIFVISGTLLVFITIWMLKSFGLIDLIVDWWNLKKGGDKDGRESGLQSGEEDSDNG